MFDNKSRSKIGAASLISLGYLGLEETDTEETSEELVDNVNEIKTDN